MVIAVLENEPFSGIITVTLKKGESVYAEPGTMVCAKGMAMSTERANRSFIKTMKLWAFGQESLFRNKFTAVEKDSKLCLAPPVPGGINYVAVKPNKPIFIQSGSYLASSEDVLLETSFEGVKGILSGESLFFIKLSGTKEGKAWFFGMGSVKIIELQAGETLQIDSGCLVGYEHTLKYTIGQVGGLKSFVFGGEGFVMNFSGHGKIWIQTRNLMGLASKLAPYFKSANSRKK